MDQQDSSHTTPPLVAGPQSTLPTAFGTFTLQAFTIDDVTHVAMLLGDIAVVDAPLVRIHSECLTGDALGSHRCDCGDQLAASLEAIAAAGTGILLYLRGQEGRGIGLFNKLRAYALRDTQGLDTVDANLALGLPADARDYRPAAQILRALGCERIQLLSSNPAKSDALQALGIDVAGRLNLQLPERPEHSGYLQSKRQRMNHDVPAGHPVLESLDDLDVYETLATHDEVIAQLAQSEDGFIAARTGDAVYVSGELDRRHLHCLRAAVGAVLVGASTVLADDPRLTVRAVTGPNPVRVVLDPRARIPQDAQLLCSSEAPTLWLVGAQATVPQDLAEHVTVVRLPDGDQPVDPHAVIAVIRERVSGSILVEGGGQTVSRFLSAGALDRLFLTRAPVLIGDGVPGIRFVGAPKMSQALRNAC